MAVEPEASKAIVHDWLPITPTPVTTASSVTFPSSTWSTTTSTGGGTWFPMEPDMTDWPADDIIDYYAKDLARRHPA